MPAFAYSDETVRVPKPPSGPTRRLPQQFAPTRPARLHWVILIGALAGFALADPVDLPQHAERSAHAQSLLQLLGR